MWLLVSKKDREKEFGVEYGFGEMFGVPLKSDRKDDDLDEKTYLVNENSIKSIEKVPSHMKKRNRTFTDTYFRFNLYYNDGSVDEFVEIHSQGDLEFYMSETESEKQYLKEIVKWKIHSNL